MTGERPRKAPIVGCEENLHIVDALVRPAVGHFARGIHRRTDPIPRPPPLHDLLRRHVPLASRSVAVAKPADRVEALKREAGRIDLAVAHGAGGVAAVLRKLLANRRGAAGVGLDRRHARWRRRRGAAEQAIHHPHAPLHRRRGRAVCRELENRCLGEQAAAVRARRKRDAADLYAVDSRNPVMHGEPLGEHCEVCIDERACGLVFGDQLADERPRLGHHVPLQWQRKLRVEIAVGVGLFDAVEFEPLVSEVGDESIAPRIGQEPVDLGVQLLRGGQRARGGGGQELIVGWRIPKPVGEPRGQGERVALAVPLVEQEIGRREHRHVGPPHGVLEALVDAQPLLNEFHVDLDHLRRHRPPQRTGKEAGQQSPRVACGIGRLDGFERTLHFLLGIVAGGHGDAGRILRRERSPVRRHDAAPCGNRGDRQVAEEPTMARRRPRLVHGSLNLEPVHGEARARVVTRQAAQLLVVAEEPRVHGDGVEDEEFAGLEPGGDLLLAGFERRRRHHAHRLAERVGDVGSGPDHRVLQARGRLDSALVPRKSPERKSQFVGTGKERRHAHVDGAAYPLAQVAEQADRVFAFRNASLPTESLLGVADRASPVVLAVVVEPGRFLRQRRVEWLDVVPVHVFEQHAVFVDDLAEEHPHARGIKPLLVDGGRRAPRGDRGIEGGLNRTGVGLDVHGRQIKAVGDLVVTGYPAVFGEHDSDVEPIEGEQIAERVLVFSRRHPPHPGAAASGDPCGVDAKQFLVEPAGDRGHLFPPRLFGACRRHLSPRDAVMDHDEFLEDGWIGEITRQHGEVEPRLRLGARVAVVAVPLEKGFNRGRRGMDHTRGGTDEHE